MDMFLQNIDLIVVKKLGEIAKGKNISSQEFLKASLKRREVQRELKDYDKGRKEKSLNEFKKLFARNNGAQEIER
ncbi:hypothetical protein M4D68_27605 [Priestia aryabhattai]|uniref:hypothetical protein n=1 Tax=Priestia aryabhattai TaxID=412384 RepID=UPI00203E96F1|nr:hypothetical protein [Priestia aryabhattai]MCM3644881.1 hypothetical protein [Priestia aryabhattai]